MSDIYKAFNDRKSNTIDGVYSIPFGHQIINYFGDGYNINIVSNSGDSNDIVIPPTDTIVYSGLFLPYASGTGTSPIHNQIFYGSNQDIAQFCKIYSSGGTWRLKNTTHSTYLRNNVLTFSCNDISSNVYYQYNINDYIHGKLPSQPTTSFDQLGCKLTTRVIMSGAAQLPISGYIPFLEFLDTSKSSIVSAGLMWMGSKWIPAITNANGTINKGFSPIQSGDWVDFTLRCQSSSPTSLRVWINNSGTFDISTSNVTNNKNAYINIGNILSKSKNLISGQDYGITVEVDSVLWRGGGDSYYYSTVDKTNHLDPPIDKFVGGGIRATRPGGVRAVLAHRSGAWKNDNFWRLGYSKSSGFASGVYYTAWSKTSDAKNMILYTDIAGLDSDTVYYYKFQYSGDGTNPYIDSYTLDNLTRKFKTLPTIGSKTLFSRHIWSCAGGVTAANPWEVGALLNYCDSSGIALTESICLGDWSYEASANGRRCETTDEYIINALQTFSNPHMARLNRSAVLWVLPDDHEVLDDFEASARPSYANTDCYAKTWEHNSSFDGYSNDLKVSELFNRAYEYFNNWWTKHWMNYLDSSPSISGFYGFRRFGRMFDAIVDQRMTGRWTQQKTLSGSAAPSGFTDPANSTCLGATQLQWFSGVAIPTFAQDPYTDTMNIITQKLWTPINTSAFTYDDYYHIASNEIKGLQDTVEFALSGLDKTVVTFVGDRHGGFWADRYFLGTNGRIYGNSTDAFKINFGCSPVASPFNVAYDQNPDWTYYGPISSGYMISYWDYKGSDGQSYGFTSSTEGDAELLFQGSCPLFTVNQSGRTINTRYWTNQGTLFAPSILQNFSLSRSGTHPL